MKIRPVVTELFHTGGWTDGQPHEANSRFSANAPKNVKAHRTPHTPDSTRITFREGPR